ncbi:MAG: VWA domain-containing protein [Pseudomonadota bacterium]
MPEQFHLMRPEWLWLLLPALAMALLLWLQRRRTGSWSNVIAPELLEQLIGETTEKRRLSAAPLLLFAWIVAAVAAAGPSWQQIPQPVHQKQDALILVLDLSLSMKAADLAPSRSDRARQKLVDLLDLRKEGQTGLIAYAGDAHIVTPLTDDHRTIANLLPALNPDMMPVPGSEPQSAIAMAAELLRSAGINGGRILLLTDGISENDIGGISRSLAGTGIELAVLGIGSAAGAPIPLPRGGFLKDASGAIVMPGLDVNRLRALANDTGGRYRGLAVDNSDIEYLLAESPLAERGDSLVLDRAADTWEDQGYWLILLLLPLVLALFRRGALPVLLLCGALLPATESQAQGWQSLWQTRDQQGKAALEAGDAKAAAELFERRDWAGTAAYQAGDYESAISAFTASEDADAYYNRGNALARAGKLDEAIDAYKTSLELEPDAQDARANIDLLEQLKQQQQQQQEQQQQGGEQGEQQSGEQSSAQQDSQAGDNQSEQAGEQQPGQNNEQPSQAGSQPSERQQQPEDLAQQEANEDEQTPADPDENSTEESEGRQPRNEAGEQQDQGDLEAQMAQATEGDPEQDQAMEQWLRRVPDDPSGLLREKFRYESRRRAEQGEQRENATYW